MERFRHRTGVLFSGGVVSTLIVKDRRQLRDNNPLHPITKVDDVEIHQKSNFESGEAQDIGHMFLCRGAKIRLGGGDDDAVLDQKIHPHGTINPVTFVNNRQRVITFKNDFPHAQLQGQAVAVGLRSQTRTEVSMNFHTGPDDEVWEFLGIKFHD